MERMKTDNDRKGLSISVIIPALNEEKNLLPTIDEVCFGLDGKFSDYEILIFNDNSNDNTGVVADGLSKINRNIRVIHNSSTMGLGYNYRKGIELAKNDYVVMFPGDNAFPRESIKKLFSQVGEADIIVPYTTNTWARPISRRVVSWLFVKLVNLLFSLDLKYYNGTVVHRRDIVKRVHMGTNGFAYQAEILVRLIRSGYSYKEVGIDLREREFGSSKAFVLRNVISVFQAITKLFWEVNVSKNGVFLTK